MRALPNPASLGLATPRGSRLIAAALGLFAFGIPLDVMIASRIGSSSMVLGAPLMAVVGWHVLVTNRLRPIPAPLILMVGFAAWGAVSVLWAHDQDLLMIWTMTCAQLLVFVLLCWQVLDSEQALSVVLTGFVAGCIGVVAGVWRAFLAKEAVGDQMYEGGTRYAAEGFDPNDMAATVAIGIPMAAYLALSGGRRTSYVALAYLPLAGSAIVLSGSRGATVTALVAVFGVLVWYGKRRRFAFTLVLALMGAGLVFAWNLVPWDTWARIFTLREQLTDQSTAGGRTQVWRAGLDLIARHPLGGVGAGGFSSAVIPALGFRLVAHNTPLSIAVELGVPGLLLYAGAFAESLRGVLKKAGDHAGFGLTLLATWAVGSASLTWELRKTTWLVLLLCTALRAMQSPSEQRAST